MGAKSGGGEARPRVARSGRFAARRNGQASGPKEGSKEIRRVSTKTTSKEVSKTRKSGKPMVRKWGMKRITGKSAKCAECEGYHRVKPCPGVIAKKCPVYQPMVKKGEQRLCNYDDPVTKERCNGHNHLAKHHREAIAKFIKKRDDKPPRHGRPNFRPGTKVQTHRVVDQLLVSHTLAEDDEDSGGRL